jgi:chromosomal replication initiator protein
MGGAVELTATELWSRVREASRASLPEQAYRTWVAAAKAVALTSDELHLEVPSRFHVEWLEDKFGPLLCAAGEQILGKPLRLRVECPEETAPIPLPSLEFGTDALASPAAPPVHQSEASRSPAPRPALNDRYTFDRFVVGTNNQLAAAASQAVADQPARMYNPLFLYGGVGLGKTHLMHAIGHELFAKDPSRRICYVSSEQFMNELVESIRQGAMAEFRRRYRQMDLLLVDDIHFLEGKERTQEEFFHTFNALYDAQRQIILTSDRPPKDLPGLEARLVSRFEWGLVVDVRPPDYETRMAILREKAEGDGIVIDDAVIEYIAQSCTDSVRELEGAVIKLLAYSSLTHKEVTLQLARTALSGVLGRGARERGPVQSPERIRELVARRWRVRPEALVSKRRTKDLTVPRQVAMYLIKETLGTSLVRIGELFGGRDHSTVIHSIRKVEEHMEKDPDFRREVSAARDELQSSTEELHDRRG